jgi:FKBP-type peptidyl-prolyl cis-trans isomerase 2
MVIQIGDLIKLSYTGKLANGAVFDTTDANVAKEYGLYNEQASYGPETIVVGKGFVVPGLDEDLIGKEIGARSTLEVPPEKGFGTRRIDLVETIPQKKFKEPVRPGMRVSVNNRTGVVESVAGGRVRVNFNAPLAGETLNYEYTIESLIEGKENKIAAILKMYSGREMEYAIDGEKVLVEVPKEFSFNQRWALAKGGMASLILELEGVKSVVFQETYNKEEKAPEAEAAKSE